MIPPLTPGNRKELDALEIEELGQVYGEPTIRTTYAEGFGHWRAGQGKPDLIADTPAVAQAMGRCAASRLRSGDVAGILTSAVHPGECGWCDYPLPVLLAALDHASWFSRFVTNELAIWRDAQGREYVRSTNRAGEYDNPEWAAFYMGATPGTSHGIAPSDQTVQRVGRQRLIDAAAGRVATPA